LLKTLANAEGAVAESIKARQVLIQGLEKILDTNRNALAAEEAQLAMVSNRRAEIDAKKKDVEDSIMRGFTTNSNPGTPAAVSPGTNHTPPAEPDRPEVEALTPPGSPRAAAIAMPAVEPPNTANFSTAGTEQPGSDLLSSLSSGNGYHGAFARPGTSSGSSLKKRKLNSGEDFVDFGGDGLDAETKAMLGETV
jgi:regulator of Ty1 transposition protein 103